jgi:hypothetical protein
LHLDGVDAEFSFICGDSGGGAKVQLLFPLLMQLGVLCGDSDFMNCIMHAFNLSFEHACKDALGDQGMNRCTVFQMCYLAILLLKTVKKQTDGNTLKSIYAKTMTSVLYDDEYRASAKESFIQAFEEIIEQVEEVESGDDVAGTDAWGLEDLLKESAKDNSADDSDSDESETTPNVPDDEQTVKMRKRMNKMKDKISQLAASCPTDIKDPNFSRWGTISAVAKVVLKHWLPLLFMAQNIVDMEKEAKKPQSYICVIATKLIELMSSKANPAQESPTHYTSLRWIVAFGDAFFDANMEWVKRQDPVFGAGSYGHISRLVPEHLFVMYKQMERLKDGGWKDVPEFAGFLKAVEGVEPAGHINKGGKEFFERLPDLFFERFNETFNEHTKKWRTPKTIKRTETR